MVISLICVMVDVGVGVLDVGKVFRVERLVFFIILVIECLCLELRMYVS